MSEKSNEVWGRIREHAQNVVEQERMLAPSMHTNILSRKDLLDSVGLMLANALSSDFLPATALKDLFDDILRSCPRLEEKIVNDLIAVEQRDPACDSCAQALLNFKGFKALQAYRIGHVLWEQGRKELAYTLQSRISEVFDVDIHPQAQIGDGIMIDHATGIVVGQTAIIGNDVSMLHGVTLGGTGISDGNRHPSVGNGVLIGAGATLIGDIRIGNDAKVASEAVVMTDIPDGMTAVGNPAKAIGKNKPKPADRMNNNVADQFNGTPVVA